MGGGRGGGIDEKSDVSTWGSEGGKNSEKCADIICEQSLTGKQKIIG